ncbi:inter-alpha-trypsin inhibitor heavy chain H6 [Scleropages formosus]|uniref:inter-alpha-trypsin inhibitor heavy chain H6 n=1 Tax=Scleropages formosus TaxID=113540 RepID=UPI0010FA9642|nr:inter-alpha-trypsin inhibitor heavy chain H6 [Scleropages formosus]
MRTDARARVGRRRRERFTRSLLHMEARGTTASRCCALLCVAAALLASARVAHSGEYGARALPRGGGLVQQRLKRQSTSARPELKVTEFHVRSSVVSRYARTTVHSSVWNQLPVTKEAVFEVDLPSTAFISNFSITSNDRLYVAQVQERATAKKIYDEAKRKGKTAGIVSTKEREVEKFRVSVSVPSGTRMSFTLSYEELLQRRLGRYELMLGLRPGQPVQNLTLEVTVAERTGLSFFRVLPLRTSRLLSNTVRGGAEPPPSTVIQQTPNCGHVRYSPTWQQQTSFSPKGLNADFILQYDVKLTDLIGDVQIYDGYFVHYFAPRGLPVVPKDVIFVIDISGSMIGTKIMQTKQAMATILGDLREGDHFNIITFSDKVHIWKEDRTVRATRQNVREAQDFVKKITATGWTNINSALLSAAQLVNPTTSSPNRTSGDQRIPLVIFLTDGEATAGVTAGEAILRNARNALGSASLFGLAFGDDADFPLLRRLSLENRGVARMVYEDADAALQLKGFYDEVASPLLSDIQLSYLDDQAFDVTRALFPNYFQGSELVVAGRVKPGVRDLKVSLTATDSKQKLKLENDVSTFVPEANGTTSSLGCVGEVQGISNFVRRLWAYFTIRELLQAKLNSSDPATQRLLGEKATNLSLKYNFVTPVTSLVVVKPDIDETAPNSTSGSTSTTTASTTISTTTTSTTSAPDTFSSMAPQPHTPLLVSKTASSSIPGTKKPSSSSSPRTSKPKVDPANKLHSSELHSTSRPVQTIPSGKASVPSSRERTAATPQSKKIPVQKPASAKTATTPYSTTAPSSAKTVFTAHPGKASDSSSEAQNDTTPDTTDHHHLHLTTLFSGLLSVPPTIPPVPATDSGVDIEVATLAAATFAPMPGVTDARKPSEASGLLDVSSAIQVIRKGVDTVVKDLLTDTYDYQIVHGKLLEDLIGLFSIMVRLVIRGICTSPFALVQHRCELRANRGSMMGQGRSLLLVLSASASSQTAQRLFSTSVDGDPHFIVWLPKLKQNLCFTIDGKADDVLRLLEDPVKGIIVDGRLMWAPSKHGFESQTRTYFDRLTISSPGGLVVTVTMDVVMLQGEGQEMLTTNRPGSVVRQGMSVTVDDHLRCWLELGQGLRFLVLFHHYKHPDYLQKPHLGLYVVDGEGLSIQTQGLLGQFQHADVELIRAKDLQSTDAGHLAEAVLRKGATKVPVSLQAKNIKDAPGRRHPDKCWVVAKGDVEKLLGHPYQSYVVNHF